MIINKSGVTIRLKMADVRIMGRATQGVRLINLGKRNDHIASVCKVMTDPEEESVVPEISELFTEPDINTDITPDANDADTNETTDNQE